MILSRIYILSICLFCFFNTKAQAPESELQNQKAPAVFRALFKTNKGDFIIEAHRDWSPKGVDRLYQLIRSGFYDNTVLFRVEQNFVIQFGISDIPAVNRFWDARKIPDEPVLMKNEKGIISYARGGVNDRATQLFINTVNNPLLDTVLRAGLKGYTPIAKVIQGMDVVAGFNGKYGRSTLAIQDSVYKYGNRYLETHYPGLDRILSAKLIQ